MDPKDLSLNDRLDSMEHARCWVCPRIEYWLVRTPGAFSIGLLRLAEETHVVLKDPEGVP